MNFFIFDQATTRWAVIVNIWFILASWAWFGWHYASLPPQVPLLYSRPWGQEQLVSPLVLSVLPFLSLAVLLLNVVLANFLIAYPFLVHLLLWGGALFSFLVLFDLVKIVSVVL